MNNDEKERIISKIICSETIANVRSRNGSLLSFSLKTPTPKQQAKSSSVYEKAFEQAILSGLLDKESLLINMIEIGRWTEKKEQEIKGLQEDIYKIRRSLLDFIFNKTKLEKVRSLLRRAESALVERLSAKHELLSTSAESQAILEQQRYLIRHITYNDDETLVWSTDSNFDNFGDIGIIIQLCTFFFLESHFSSKVIRELARSQQWRSYWEVAKVTNQLFENPVSHWSWNQKELAYWSTIYDSVYEAYEKPSKSVIGDDDLLDSWFIRQTEKNDKTNKSSSIPQSNKSGRNEMFIMTDKAGAKEVYNMNDPASRVRIKAKQKMLAQKGSVKEQHMPDSQREMRESLLAKQSRHVKDIRSKR